MNAWLTGRRGQGLAVAIALLGVFLAWFGVVDPAAAWFQDRQMLLEQRRALLTHMRTLAVSLPALRSTAANPPDTAGPARMLTGGSDAVAAADLQERLQAMATAAGVSLTAIETLPPAAAGNWQRVSLRITMNASWPVLMELVRSIEDSPVRMFIDDTHFLSPVVVAHPAALPIQGSMVVYGFRPGSGAGS